jgi:hypothetical protein
MLEFLRHEKRSASPNFEVLSTPLEDLLEMSPKDTYVYLFETLDIHPFLRIASKLVDADYSGAQRFYERSGYQFSNMKCKLLNLPT